MVDKALGLMSYYMHLLALFSSRGFVQSNGQPLVFLHCIVFNLLEERQILSIPKKIPFLVYDSLVDRRGLLVGMQGINGPLPQMIRTCWLIHMVYDHISFYHALFGHHDHEYGHKHRFYLCVLFRTHNHLYHSHCY